MAPPTKRKSNSKANTTTENNKTKKTIRSSARLASQGITKPVVEAVPKTKKAKLASKDKNPEPKAPFPPAPETDKVGNGSKTVVIEHRKMALVFNAKHNICANLDKSQKNSDDFHSAIDFLLHSNLFRALTENPKIVENHIRSFWSSAVVSVVDNVQRISSTIEDKPLIITEAVVRRILGFGDECGPSILPDEEVYTECRRMGYEGVFPKSMVKKANVSYQWRYLMHIFIHCLSCRKGGFDDMSLTLSSSFVAFTTGRSFNFSGMIFYSLVRNAEDSGRNKYLMYPRFLQMIINSEIQGLSSAGDELKLDHMNWKVFNNMKKDHPKSIFSGNITPLFDNMLQVKGEYVNENAVENDVAIEVEGENVDVTNSAHENESEAADSISVNEDIDVGSVDVVKLVAAASVPVFSATSSFQEDSDESSSSRAFVDVRIPTHIGANPMSSPSTSVSKDARISPPASLNDFHVINSPVINEESAQVPERESVQVPQKDHVQVQVYPKLSAPSLQNTSSSSPSDVTLIDLFAQNSILQAMVKDLQDTVKSQAVTLSTQQLQINELYGMIKMLSKKKSTKVVYTFSSRQHK